jgi:uncharacterized protein
MLDADFLALLRCPLTMQPLRLAPPDLLARLPVPLDAALVREDGAVVYPIRDGIPVLLPEEAIAVVSRAN